MRYLEPQTQTHQDTYLIDAANVAEPEHWSDAHRFHTTHLHRDILANQEYTKSCFYREYSLYILFSLHDTLDHSVDTKILWLRQNRIVFHEVLVSGCVDDICESTVYQGQSTSPHQKSIAPKMQILHFLCITPLDYIHGVRRTNSQFASACASSCFHQGIMDTRITSIPLYSLTYRCRCSRVH
jgi:hypothetical protein